jgi:carboxypeptidase Q
MFRKSFGAMLIMCLATAASAQQVEKIDDAMNAKIRTEGFEHSKLLTFEHFLADVYGPRPIGSPNQVAAANWAMKTMTAFGMKNAHLEPFTWRGVGWMPLKASGFITSPVKANIKFEVAPWSPSTKGTVSGQVVSVIAPVNPTEAELTAWLVTMAAKVKGAIVMVGPPPNVPVNFAERPKRTPDDQVKARYQPTDANAAAEGRGGRGGTPGAGGRGGRGGAAPEAMSGKLNAQQVNARITALLRDNLPALRLIAQGGGRIPGVIVAQNGAGQIYDDVTPQPPAVILRTDDYGRIFRILQDGTPVSVEFNVVNQFYPEGKTSYVTVAEIPGTDKADEVVMMGGHLDSWTSATGATDNAIGCAIMMEAARIIIASGGHPRRTVRVALWSGEEEGEYGSFAYVKNHFGTAEAPTKDFNKLQAYWNIDDGTGLVRGASIFGPPAAATALAQIVKPFEDLGIYGALPSSARVEGGSDNGAFAVAGLPGIGTQQDNIEYNSTTWHTNLDTYERIVPEDVTKNAVITASVMLHLANRDEMLPRFEADKMPAVPAARVVGDAAVTATPHVYTLGKNKILSAPAPGLLGTFPREGVAPMTVEMGTKPTHGKVTLKVDGSFSYVPNAGYVGMDSFTYKAKRGTETSAESTVTLSVTL